MRNLSILLLALALCWTSVLAQNERGENEDVIRCYTTEADAIRRADNPSLGTLEQFEEWLAPRVRNYELNASSQRAVVTIPIVFHIIHNNGADNLSASFVNSQIEQLNYDFRRTFGTSGYNTQAAGADTEIEFCAVTIDPNGNPMAEPGINRVNRSSAGFSAPPYSQSYYESTLKPNTIWDPNQYCNVWVSGLSGGLLGYAQFPEAASLPGIGTGNGGASTDGVVVLYTSVGSSTNPHPNGGVYAGGRTLTHELGHWLGLRHIWGDGGCNVDDYCDDTPRASSSTNGCPTKNTCNDISYGASSNPNDMVENYMDYSYDNCMNIFTNDQKARMQTVITSSVRRASLLSSTKCGGGGGGGDTQAPTTPTNLTASAITTTTTTLSWNASSDNVGVTGYDVALNGSVLGTVTGTSANITGLSPATTYNATVTARDAAGNTSGGASTSFTTLSDAGSCVGGSVTLTINLDNYPEETSWTVTSGGSTVASGGTYGSQPDGSTVVENINLGAGNYTFTINDSYGDGICCGYGNGSYSLASGGTVIVSGGNFGASEATNFCVDGGPAPDTQAPSTPTNVNAFNVGVTSADVSWNASSDNVGVTGYNVYLDGSLVGSTAGTSTSLSGLSASTSYTVSVRALDAAGNISGSGSDGFTTQAGADTQAPSTPGNVTAFNVGETTADVSWNASSDNVGVTGYNVYLDGSLIGNTNSTSASLSGLTSNTGYTVSVRATDAAGNLSGTGSDNFTTTGGGGGGPTTDLLFGHFFETGWQGWVDGGSDCYRYSGSRSYEGSRSIRLRDNSGTASSMTLNNINVTGYDQLDLQFYFYPNSMENGEDFWVRVNDGSGYQTIATYARGTNFNNNTFYEVNITLSSNDFNFNSGFDLRIQCDASANADRIYIDQISLTGTVNGRYVPVTSSTITELGSLNAKGEEAESNPMDLIAFDDLGISVYPNPAKDVLNIVSNDEDALIRVFSVTGVMVTQQQLNAEDRITLDIANWQAGTYIVTVQSGDDILHQKFIKY